MAAALIDEMAIEWLTDGSGQQEALGKGQTHFLDERGESVEFSPGFAKQWGNVCKEHSVE